MLAWRIFQTWQYWCSFQINRHEAVFGDCMLPGSAGPDPAAINTLGHWNDIAVSTVSSCMPEQPVLHGVWYRPLRLECQQCLPDQKRHRLTAETNSCLGQLSGTQADESLTEQSLWLLPTGIREQ